MKTKVITRRSLMVFHKRFEILRDEKKGEEINKYLDRANKLQRKLSGQIVKEGEGHDKDPNAKHEIISLFKSTSWYIYERFLDSIGRKVITFDDVDKDGVLNVEVNTAREGMPSVDWHFILRLYKGISNYPNM